MLLGVKATVRAEETKGAMLSLVMPRRGYWERYSEHAMGKEALKDLNTPMSRGWSKCVMCTGRQRMCTSLACANSINWIDTCTYTCAC